MEGGQGVGSSAGHSRPVCLELTALLSIQTCSCSASGFGGCISAESIQVSRRKIDLIEEWGRWPGGGGIASHSHIIQAGACLSRWVVDHPLFLFSSRSRCVAAPGSPMRATREAVWWQPAAMPA